MKLFQKEEKGKEKSLYLGFIILFITILICFLFLELGFRIYYFVSYSGSIKDAYEDYENPEKGTKVNMGQMIRPSPYRNIVYEPKPFLDVYYYYMEVPVKTNSLGWRDKEFLKEKPQNTVRIIGLGDSVMFGWAISENERYMDILETKLNENFPEINWETFVFAFPTYNLKMEVEVLKQYALDYSPDIIIYGYVGNDDCLPKFLLDKKKFFSKELFILDYLFEHVEYARFFNRNLQGEKNSKICHQKDAPDQYKDLVGGDSYYESLKELAKIGKTNGIPIIFLSHVEPDVYRMVPYENVYYFDPVKEQQEYLQENTRESLFISSTDKHPSVAAHGLLGQAIYNQLINNGFIKDLMLK